MKQIDVETVRRFYEYFYQKIYIKPKYIFNPSKTGMKMIENFIKLLDKEFNIKLIGEDFLWSYFIYQFNYWRNAELKSFFGKMQISYIIGQKAFLRYKEDKHNLMWVTEKSEIIERYILRKKDLINNEEKIIYQARYEESIKKMHLNTDKGFYFCIENTTLYHPKHKSCMFCKFKNDCKKVLKEKFPKLYEQRTNS